MHITEVDLRDKSNGINYGICDTSKSFKTASVIHTETAKHISISTCDIIGVYDIDSFENIP